MDIELYIGGLKCDLSENTNLLFNYRVKDLTNPTVVKNSFTKTVELQGTDANNKVFGHLWELDRVQKNNFNPSKRVSFELFKDGELIETGYVKLDSIKNDEVPTYSVTLYGGLGDFFYNLMYDGGGEKRTLANLQFPYDLDFNITKETVKEAWDSLNSQSPTGKWSIINFAPCYNGYPDLISADKVIVNNNNYAGSMRVYNENTNTWETTSVGFPVNQDTYRLFHGYGLAELPHEMTEWETRDLRSYLQRPVISMKAIIDACCDPINNGGYTVDLDDEFFSSSNPYYKYGYVTLPQLSNLGIQTSSSGGDETWNVDITAPVYTPSYGNTAYFPVSTSTLQTNTTYNISLNLDVVVSPHSSTYSGNPGNVLYTSANGISGSGVRKNLWGGYAVQMVGVDANGNEVCGSDIAWLTSELNGQYFNYTAVTEGFYHTYFIYGQPVVNKGYFVKNGTKFRWNTPINLTMRSSTTTIAAIRIKVAAGSDHAFPNACYSTQLLPSTYQMYTFRATADTMTDISSSISEGGNTTSALFSGSRVTKADLLSTANSPADYFLSYCKLFNLYFYKDKFEKKVYVRTQRHFYDGEHINIDDIIDHSKPITMSPLTTFDTKWYAMQYKADNPSVTATDYKTKFGVEYGVQKIDTGYDFDASMKNLLNDTIFKNAVQVQEISNYYSHRQSNYDAEEPTFLYDGIIEWKLMNLDGDATTIKITGPATAIEGYFNSISTKSVKYDAFPKPQFHDKDNKAVDGSNVLLFYNGYQNITSTSLYQPYYWLSDDVPEMLVLNDEKPCWLYTNSPLDPNGNTIAIRLTTLPCFSRYTTLDNTNKIFYTWDIGRVQQLYVPNMDFMSSESTIYEIYWKKYLTDLYDIDTRTVEAYVTFKEPVVQDYLKHYYWWNNCYWVINEITDYNPLDPQPTKVKFVKVNTLDSYTDYDPAEMPQGIIKLTLDSYMIGAEGGTIGAYIYVGDGGLWYFDGMSEGITPSITGGSGSQHFTITVAPNSGANSIEHFIVAFADYGDMAKFTQLGRTSSFSVSPTTISTSAGETETFGVQNPYGDTWRISHYPTWVTVDTTGGTGSTIVNVTTNNDVITQTRSDYITVYNSTTLQSYNITITQYSDAGESGNTSVLSVEEYNTEALAEFVDARGETIPYKVKSVGPWRCYTSAYYANPIEYQGTGNTEQGEIIHVEWEESDKIYKRSATITFENINLGNTVEVTKYQESVNTVNVTFDATGGTQILNTLDEVDAHVYPLWLTVEYLENGFRIRCEANTGSARQGLIIVRRPNDADLYIYCNQYGV